MKKFSIIAAIVVVVIIGTWVSTDVSAYEIFHKHEYEVETMDADCVNDGYNFYICECGDSYKEKIADPIGHNYVTKINIPTCEEEGYHLHFCSICGHEYKDNYIEKVEHDFSEWVIVTMPNKENNGVESHICKCGYEETREYICEHGDVYEDIVENASCKKSGKVNIICSICESVVEERVVPATEHKFGNWKTTSYASPNSNGEKIRTCSCGETEKKVIEFEMAGSNSFYIPSAGINAKYTVEAFTQKAVDTYDVVCNYTRLNKDNPIILGHNTGSMKYLYNTKIGSNIYVSVDGVIYTYVVKISEKATEVENGKELQGLNTGYKLLNSREGQTLRLYTCYQDKELGKIRWIVMAEKIA